MMDFPGNHVRVPEDIIMIIVYPNILHRNPFILNTMKHHGKSLWILGFPGLTSFQAFDGQSCGLQFDHDDLSCPSLSHPKGSTIAMGSSEVTHKNAKVDQQFLS